MDKPRVGGESRADHRSAAGGSEEGGTAGGAVYTFVEIAELRRIMGRLTAIEMLRLMLVPDAQPHGA